MTRTNYNKCDVTSFHARLFEVIGGQVTLWSKKLGVTPGTIRDRWHTGSFPRVNLIIKFCDISGVSADWLLLGKGDRYGFKDEGNELESFNNEKLLEQVIMGVDQGLNKNNLVLAADKKAQLIILLYKHYKDTGKEINKETIHQHLRLVAA